MNRQPAQTIKTVSRLQGMRDLPEDTVRHARELQDRLSQLLSGYGYRMLDTPVLETTELFLRKSGGELASQLYSFTDAGSNSVSLRPQRIPGTLHAGGRSARRSGRLGNL